MMKFNKTLWTVQGLLAFLFLFAGGMKLVMPLEGVAGPIALPGWFIRFLGVAEVLGAIGLILPQLLRIWPVLTPVAAAGLVIIMAGATVITAMGGAVAPALFPLMVGLLLATVAYRRGQGLTSAPHAQSRPYTKASWQVFQSSSGRARFSEDRTVSNASARPAASA
jgi:hypothetical protein